MQAEHNNVRFSMHKSGFGFAVQVKGDRGVFTDMCEGLEFFARQFTPAERAVGIHNALAPVANPDWHDEKVEDPKGIV